MTSHLTSHLTSHMTRSTWSVVTTALAMLLTAASTMPASAAPAAADPLAGAPAVGECRAYSLKDREGLHEDSPAVDCAGPHTALVVKVKIAPDKYTALFSSPEARAGIDLFFTAWYTSMADPMDMYNVLRTGEFSNYGGWSDPEFDAAANKAIATALDDPSRTAAVIDAQAKAADQLPWLPLYAPPTSLWLGDRITGAAPSINYLYYPWAATIGSK